jgi:dipeptidyl aminopeptidase/acylaminoacyl peptidase
MLPAQRLKRFLRLLIFTLVVVMIFFLVILPAGGSYLYIRALLHHACNNRPESLTQRLSQPDQLEAFTFAPNGEDFQLDAWFAAGTNGAGIIVLPGAWGGADTMYREMEFLHQAGYNVMTYDTRSCADPPQETSLGYTEIADLQTALDIMSQRPEVDPDRIGVFGHSMGGATVIMTAAQDERIKAVVVTGNYADLADDVRHNPNSLVERWIRGWIEWFYEWDTAMDIESVSPLNVIGQISPRPILLIHGSRELEESRGMEQFTAAGEPKELFIVEGAGHGGYASTDFENYAARTIAFFDRYLR